MKRKNEKWKNVKKKLKFFGKKNRKKNRKKIGKKIEKKSEKKSEKNQKKTEKSREKIGEKTGKNESKTILALGSTPNEPGPSSDIRTFALQTLYEDAGLVRYSGFNGRVRHGLLAVALLLEQTTPMSFPKAQVRPYIMCIMCIGIPNSQPTVRAAENIWCYQWTPMLTVDCGIVLRTTRGGTGSRSSFSNTNSSPWTAELSPRSRPPEPCPSSTWWQPPMRSRPGYRAGAWTRRTICLTTSTWWCPWTWRSLSRNSHATLRGVTGLYSKIWWLQSSSRPPSRRYGQTRPLRGNWGYWTWLWKRLWKRCAQSAR